MTAAATKPTATTAKKSTTKKPAATTKSAAPNHGAEAPSPFPNSPTWTTLLGTSEDLMRGWRGPNGDPFSEIRAIGGRFSRALVAIPGAAPNGRTRFARVLLAIAWLYAFLLALAVLPFLVAWRAPFALAPRIASIVGLSAVYALVVGLYATTAVREVPTTTRPNTSAVSTAAPSVTAVKPTGSPAPAAYSVFAREDVSFGGRTRYVIRVAVPSPGSTDQKIATLAHIARTELRGSVTTVFAYRSEAEFRSGAGYTVGRASVSSDGRGWSGDGRFDDGADDGSIVGSIVTAVDERLLMPSSQQAFVTAR